MATVGQTAVTLMDEDLQLITLLAEKHIFFELSKFRDTV